MRSARLWFATQLILAFAAVGGCGGASDGSGGSGAGSIGGTGQSGGGVTCAGSIGGTGQSGGGMTSAGTQAAGEAGSRECDEADCGPRLGLPNWTCVDGSVGGPTGRCVAGASGTCGWEVNDCPAAGEGGASAQGGQGNAAGAASDDCGGCSSGTICVYQVGGPGPGRFVCAAQEPCRSAEACACIIGQGTCQPEMGDPPRYCSCDNGLD